MFKKLFFKLKPNIFGGSAGNKKKFSGFALLELLAVVLAVGFLFFGVSLASNVYRMNARDASRAGDIVALKQALEIYFKDSATGYPASTGECVSAVSGVGAELKAAKVLSAVPLDPLWPSDRPEKVKDGAAGDPSREFCFYYFSGARDQYKISYFLETNSKSGAKGINVLSNN